MNFSLQVIAAAVIKTALMFVPSSFRWAVRLVSEAVGDWLNAHPENGSEVVTLTATGAAPDELKVVVAGLFDRVSAMFAGKPFILMGIAAVKTFVINNLLDAVLTQLTTKPEDHAQGFPTPMYDMSAAAAKLGEQLGEAVESPNPALEVKPEPEATEKPAKATKKAAEAKPK